MNETTPQNVQNLNFGYITERVCQRFKIAELHPHQLQAIESAINKRDVLVISPTGSGKSLPPWAISWLRGGLTICVQPLRSLIADHARRLQSLDLECSTWNSDVTDHEKDSIVTRLRNGWKGILLTTPESLKNTWLSDALQASPKGIDMVFIDEAHCCLRERAFRIQYAWLGNTLARLQPLIRYACTATLPSEDQPRLIKALGLVTPTVITAPVARSNLTIEIVPRTKTTLASILDRHHLQSGVIFCSTVRTANALHSDLLLRGFNVILYHGQLQSKEKRAAQRLFIESDQTIAVVTDAFLLGIDKPNIRWTAHWDFPKSIEDWVQGFGRAGRDELPANCYGHFKQAEEGLNSREFLLRSSLPTLRQLEVVFCYLASKPFHDCTASDIGEAALGKGGKWSGPAAMTTLKRYHLVNHKVNPNDRRKRLYSAKGNFQHADWGAYFEEREASLKKFDQLVKLVSGEEVPKGIDRYFGGNGK